MPTEGSPPVDVISAAVTEAIRSPCAKSKRGAVIFLQRVRPEPRPSYIVASGHNSPPDPHVCRANDICRQHCNKLAMHAEQRAILQALHGEDGLPGGLDLLHVKVVDNQLVPGGPPSCWQCSRLVLEVGIHVWLYEGTPRHERECSQHCGFLHVWGPDQDTNDDRDDCPNCGLELSPISKTFYDHPAVWRRYNPSEFHYTTLLNNGIRLDP